MTEKKPTKQELIDHVESLVAKCAELTRERDEARREVCECKCSPPKTPFFGASQELAEVNGWDCFKENIDE